MRRLILRIKNAIVRGFKFLRDVDYYYSRRYSLRASILMAKNTL